jgi:hypothetical protein
VHGRFKNPEYLPPADLAGPDLRAYEGAIAQQLSEFGRAYGWVSVDLEGEKPDTVIVIKINGGDLRFPLWASEYPTSGAAEYGFLDSAPSVAAAIFDDWASGTLDT